MKEVIFKVIFYPPLCIGLRALLKELLILSIL